MAHLLSASCGCNCAHRGDGDGTVPAASSTELMTHLDLRSSARVQPLRLIVCVFVSDGVESRSAFRLHSCVMNDEASWEGGLTFHLCM